jgi:hypothetical protein
MTAGRALIVIGFLAFAGAGLVLGWHVAWPIVAFLMAGLVAL